MNTLKRPTQANQFNCWQAMLIKERAKTGLGARNDMCRFDKRETQKTACSESFRFPTDS